MYVTFLFFGVLSMEFWSAGGLTWELIQVKFNEEGHEIQSKASRKKI